jgi:hypothetical protein
MGSQNPNDLSSTASLILPNVERVMNESNAMNIICSGCKTPESERQNFYPEKIIGKFTPLMMKLPITIATFSPAIGGSQCYVVIKDSEGEFSTLKAHEDIRYQKYANQFKKPGIGMLAVIKDLVQQDPADMIMIGDTWHDKIAAQKFGIPFLDAKHIHQLSKGEVIESFFMRMD